MNGLEITADGNYSHENKRCLLLGRKAMTSLDSILKSTNYFADKGYLVKAMVLQVVMYEYESWTLNKAECRRLYAFELWH